MNTTGPKLRPQREKLSNHQYHRKLTADEDGEQIIEHGHTLDTADAMPAQKAEALLQRLLLIKRLLVRESFFDENVATNN